MDRHARSGMWAVAGLVSGITVLAAYPFLRKSIQRVARLLTYHEKKPATDSPCDSYSKILFSFSTDSTPDIIPTETETGSNDLTSEEASIETNSTCSSVSEEESDTRERVEKESVYPNDLPKISKQVIQQLENFNIFTDTVVYEKDNRNSNDNTIYCKNLFLKDRKGKFYYFICREEKNVHLRQLKYKLHAHRNFSFASPEEVTEQLNVRPGCITPFAFLSGDAPTDIAVAISRDLMFEKKLNFHPLHENYATRISFGHLLKLFGHLKRKLAIIDL